MKKKLSSFHSQQFRWLSFVLVLSLLFGISSYAMAAPQSKRVSIREEKTTLKKADYVPGEIIVVYKKDADSGTQKSGGNYSAMRNKKNSSKPKGKEIGVDTETRMITVNAGEEEAQIEEYLQDPDVLYAQPNYQYQCLDIVPNDPLYAANQQNFMRLIQAEKGWEISKGNASVIIAVIDTGITLNHEDLEGVFVNQANTIESTISHDDASVKDEHGHGTRMAGIIAAQMDNNKGITGIAPDCRIMPIKAGRFGFESDDVCRAIRYAVDNGAAVINMSIGGYYFDQMLLDACNYAEENGVIVVAAAGNADFSTGDKTRYEYPASNPSVIAVSGVDENGNTANYTYNASVKVAAPAKQVYSTHTTGSYVSASGTSLATPMVAAVCGLIISNNPGITTDQVKQILYSTAQDKGASGYDVVYGYGILNMFGALSQTPESTDAFEPNNVNKLATPILTRSSTAAKLSYGDDIDVYRFSVDTKSELTVSISTPINIITTVPCVAPAGGGVPTDLYTLQQNKSNLLKTIQSGTSPSKTTYTLEPGTYYISITAAKRGEFSDKEYQLVLSNPADRTELEMRTQLVEVEKYNITINSEPAEDEVFSGKQSFSYFGEKKFYDSPTPEGIYQTSSFQIKSANGQMPQDWNNSNTNRDIGWYYGNSEDLNLDSITEEIGAWTDIINIANNTRIVPGGTIAIIDPTTNNTLAAYADVDINGNSILDIDEVAYTQFIAANKIVSDPVEKLKEITYEYSDNNGIRVTTEVHNYERIIETTYNLSVLKTVGTIRPVEFVAVDNISNVPDTTVTGTPLVLSGAVTPANATNQIISWSVKNAGTTQATISDNVLFTSAAGIATITATVANGLTKSTPYEKDFTIEATEPAIIVEPVVLTGINITNLPEQTTYTVGDALNLNGLVVTATYSDDSNETITNYSTNPVNGTALNNAGAVPVTVQFEGKTTSFNISVSPASLTVSMAATPTIVETLAAYISIAVSGEWLVGKEATAWLEAGDELLYPTPITQGQAHMYISNAPEAGIYEILVKTTDGLAQGSCFITVTSFNSDIWTLNYSLTPETFITLVFNETISAKDGKFDKEVSVNGKSISCTLDSNNKTLTTNMKYENLTTGKNTFSVAGVKLPNLFPSYSFTFSIDINKT